MSDGLILFFIYIYEMKKTQNYPQVANDITKNLIHHFSKNLSSVLLYGSSTKQEKFWDLDLLILLHSKNTPAEDLSFLKTIFSTYQEHTLDLQLFYAEEVVCANTFSLDAHGAFFSKVLSDATVLYGENPFSKLTPNEDLVTISLLNRIQRYIFQARQEYLGVGRFNKDKNPEYHKKHLRRTLLDVMMLFGTCYDVNEAERAFKKLYPNVFTKKEWDVFEHASGTIEEYISLYEKVYEIAQEVSYVFIPKKIQPIKRHSSQGLVFEYVIPEVYSQAIILVDGLPHKPDLSNIMQILASWGYAVFFPRLRGTWESTGTFLDHNPANDIHELAQELKNGIKLDDTVVQTQHVIALGSSFGGLVSLHASTHNSISHALAFSPPYLISEVPNIENLTTYLERAFGQAYRYKQQDWQNFIENNLLSLKIVATDPNFNPSKCTIVGGTHDPLIDCTQLQQQSTAVGIQFFKQDADHIALHKNTQLIFPILHSLLKTLL